jgi:hypothetical protein
VEAVRLHVFEVEEFYHFSRVGFESAVVGHQQDLLGGVLNGDAAMWREEVVVLPESATLPTITELFGSPM